MDRYEYSRSVIIERARYLEEITVAGEDALRADWLECKASFRTHCDRWGWMNDLQAVREGFGDTGIPFVLWESQIEISDWILSYLDLPSVESDIKYERKRNTSRETTILAIPKGRKIGVTEVVLKLEEWLMIYWKMTSVSCSKKAEDVDKKGDHRTLFERLDFSITRLPPHIRPPRYWRKEMTISDLDSSASILGEAATGDILRSGRAVLALLDEWATIEPNIAESQLAAIHSACDVAVIVSNPPRKRHPIHKLCENLPAKQIMNRSWEDDPWRPKTYFEDQLLENGGTLTREDAERELNGSLEIKHSSTLFVFNKDRVKKPQDVSGWPISIVGFDFGTGGALTVSNHGRLWLGGEGEINQLGQLAFRLEVYEEHQWKGAHVKTIAADILPSLKEAAAISTHQFIVGDPTGRNQISPTRGSWQSELWNVGIKVQCLEEGFNSTSSKEDALNKFQELHSLGMVSVLGDCPWLIESMGNWVWPFKSGETRIDYVKIEPEKSVYSHSCEAFLYMIHKAVMLAEELRREREAVLARKDGKLKYAAPLALRGAGSRRAIKDLYRGMRS